MITSNLHESKNKSIEYAWNGLLLGGGTFVLSLLLYAAYSGWNHPEEPEVFVKVQSSSIAVISMMLVLLNAPPLSFFMGVAVFASLGGAMGEGLAYSFFRQNSAIPIENYELPQESLERSSIRMS